MRIVTIIGMLIVGIVGLLMSVCGGFFFFAGAWQSLVALMNNKPNPIEFGPWPLIIIGGACLVGGGAVFWLCCRYAWRQVSAGDPDGEGQ